jgi:hypothetical protein
MSGEKHFIAFAIAGSLGILGAASTAWAQSGGYDYDYEYEYEGGYVKPCSLDGVNPTYHPEIFANPAAAREYGFAQSRDGTWHTQNLKRSRKPVKAQAKERHTTTAGSH